MRNRLPQKIPPGVPASVNQHHMGQITTPKFMNFHLRIIPLSPTLRQIRQSAFSLWPPADPTKYPLPWPAAYLRFRDACIHKRPECALRQRPYAELSGIHVYGLFAADVCSGTDCFLVRLRAHRCTKRDGHRIQKAHARCWYCSTFASLKLGSPLYSARAYLYRL